jgi:hypothetical protein
LLTVLLLREIREVHGLATSQYGGQSISAIMEQKRRESVHMIAVRSPELVMTEVTEPEENANIKAQRERFRKNSDWLQVHVPQVYAQHRGKFICVAGQELFIADTAPEVVAMARKAHPEDDGPLLRYIPREKMERVYAHTWALDAVR